MCDHENREAAMVVIEPGTPERHGRDGVWCDPCLEPLVRALNDGGLSTIASCCGHGSKPGSVILADGRWLMILPSRDAANEFYASPAPAAPVAADTEMAVCNADGISHDPHVWDFGSGESFRCPGYLAPAVSADTTQDPA